jgi:hypothetical protein
LWRARKVDEDVEPAQRQTVRSLQLGVEGLNEHGVGSQKQRPHVMPFVAAALHTPMIIEAMLAF